MTIILYEKYLFFSNKLYPNYHGTVLVSTARYEEVDTPQYPLPSITMEQP